MELIQIDTLKKSLDYYENLKKELEARKTKKARVLFRKQLVENQAKVNYTNELNRIRGELSSYDTRFPILTLENLYNRAMKLKELGAKIGDENDKTEFNNQMEKIKKDIDTAVKSTKEVSDDEELKKEVVKPSVSRRNRRKKRNF